MMLPERIAFNGEKSVTIPRASNKDSLLYVSLKRGIQLVMPKSTEVAVRAWYRLAWWPRNPCRWRGEKENPESCPEFSQSCTPYFMSTFHTRFIFHHELERPSLEACLHTLVFLQQCDAIFGVFKLNSMSGNFLSKFIATSLSAISVKSNSIYNAI